MGNKTSKKDEGSDIPAEEAEKLKELSSQFVQKILDESKYDTKEELFDALYNGDKQEANPGFITEFPSGRIQEQQFVTRLTKESHGKNEAFWDSLFHEFDKDKQGLSFSQYMQARQKLKMNA